MTKPTDPSIRLLADRDLDRVRALFGQLSAGSRYFRFFSVSDGAAEAELSYLHTIDGHDRLALVAETDAGEIVGLARYHRSGPDRAEVAVVVDDAWQHHGVGRRLLTRLAAQARRHGVDTLEVAILGDNIPAIKLFHRLALDSRLQFDHGVFEGSIALAG